MATRRLRLFFLEPIAPHQHPLSHATEHSAQRAVQVLAAGAFLFLVADGGSLGVSVHEGGEDFAHQMLSCRPKYSRVAMS